MIMHTRFMKRGLYKKEYVLRLAPSVNVEQPFLDNAAVGGHSNGVIIAAGELIFRECTWEGGVAKVWSVYFYFRTKM